MEANNGLILNVCVEEWFAPLNRQNTGWHTRQSASQLSPKLCRSYPNCPR